MRRGWRGRPHRYPRSVLVLVTRAGAATEGDVWGWGNNWSGQLGEGMVAYLLDANHASPLVTRHHPLRQRGRGRMVAGDTFAICVPVLTEVLFGISLLPRAAQNRAEWARFEARFPCYVPDASDGRAAATLQLALRRQGRQLATVDATIAAVALRHDLVLLTTDRDFTAVPHLTLDNWL